MEPVMMEPFRQSLYKEEMEKPTLDLLGPPAATPATTAPPKSKRANLITDSDIKWLNVFALSTVHIFGVYGLWMCLSGQVKLLTFLFQYPLGLMTSFGVTAGAHRYYTHRSFKATKPLQILMIACFSLAGQNPLFEWVRDHRVHHKFSETDADPHNSHRGFFFSHVGWLMTKKHPDVKRKGKVIDMSDIINDPYVTIHRRYFILWELLAFFIPMYLPVYLFGESLKVAFFIAMLRYAIALNVTWSVNSVAHIWGYRPYDLRVKAVENKYVAMFAFGEGWHNYHHVFPWDYRASELGYDHNTCTSVIDWFAKIGWAYDLKKPSPELIRSVMEKHGPPKTSPQEVDCPTNQKNLQPGVTKNVHVINNQTHTLNKPSPQPNNKNTTQQTIDKHLQKEHHQ